MLVEKVMCDEDIKEPIALNTYPTMWRYRQAVTIQSVTTFILNSTTCDRWHILRLFLKEVKYVMLLYYICTIYLEKKRLWLQMYISMSTPFEFRYESYRKRF